MQTDGEIFQEEITERRSHFSLALLDSGSSVTSGENESWWLVGSWGRF